MTSPPDLFSFESVGVSVDGSALLADLTTTVPAAGISVVVGPSGSGKTTLLRLCNRLEVATRGTVRYRGEPVMEIDPRTLRRRVGMVFQKPTLLPGSVRDNLLVARPEADGAELAAALTRAEVDPAMLDQAADTLSGGEGQRVCIARTMLAGPEVLLMDEPTAALDVGLRLGLERLAVALARAGTPMLWVTHDLAQARRMADHVMVLIDGKLRAAGPAALLDDEADAVVAAFVRGERDAR